jgi:esterase/lipase superfamily enzyme
MRSQIRHLVNLAGACGAVLFSGGCRVPDPPILKDSPPQVLYDTRYERDNAEGEIIPAVATGVWDDYHDTLAEPVAVREWGEFESTWEVFFATNRGILPEGAGTPRESFGNYVLERPVYGRGVVTLPKHHRGQDIYLKKPEDLRTRWQKEWASAPPVAYHLAKFESLKSCSPQAFTAGVARQVQASRQRDVLLFVHGFNVNLEAALVRVAQFGWDMPFNGALVAYSWPTQGGVQNYAFDEPINRASIGPFVEFLQTLRGSLPEDARIHIVVHSMGNRLVMQALNRLPLEKDGPPPFASVCLCAPDVGEQDFQAWIPGVVARSERVSLYCSASDSALILSEGLHSERRAGDAETPLRAAGVDTIDCTRVGQSLSGHSYFATSVDVLTDLFSVIKENKSPEERPYLARQGDATGEHHWIFDAHPGEILWTWNFDETENHRTGEQPREVAEVPPEPQR